MVVSKNSDGSSKMSETKFEFNPMGRYINEARMAQLEKDYPIDTKVVINAPIQKIKDSYNKYHLIDCKGSFGSTEADWAVACGNFTKINHLLKENGEKEINLFEYLSELLPRRGNKIGLITFQNGIQNTLADFKKMGQSILNLFPERPLCIGLYNPTRGILNDLNRVFSHHQAKEIATICCTRLMITTISNLLLEINPDLRWLHIAHSEGGAIAHLALKHLAEKNKKHMRQCLITALYGPVLPVPKKFAYKTYNTYSKDDNATLRWGQEYTNNSDYDIKIVDSLMEKHSNLKELSLGNKGLGFGIGPVLGGARLVDDFARTLPPGDHGFMDKTYQQALEDNIQAIRNAYKIVPKFW